MFKKVLKMLEDVINPYEPIMLGLSGGPDSMALLLHLLHIRKSIPFELHIAHYNHKIRPSSDDEEKKLITMLEPLDVCIHVGHYDGEVPNENLEDFFRTKRYEYLRLIYQKIKATSLLLGHQKDDLAETVIKRIFEGAQLQNFVGIRYDSFVFDMHIVRPLLGISKKEIYDFLSRHSQSFFIDESNKSDVILRGRMRTKLLPFIETAFGKNILNNLEKLSQRAAELDDYLDENTLHLYHLVKESSFGLFIDLTSSKPLHKVEFTHFITKLLSGFDLVPTSDQVDTLFKLYKDKAINKRVEISNKNLIIDRERLFVINDQPIEFSVIDGPFRPTSWKDFWSCQISISCPNDYFLKVVDLDTICRNGKTLRDWYSENHVPVFLRKKMVVAVKDGIVYQEFLTGKSLKSEKIMLDL